MLRNARSNHGAIQADAFPEMPRLLRPRRRSSITRRNRSPRSAGAPASKPASASSRSPLTVKRSTAPLLPSSSSSSAATPLFHSSAGNTRLINPIACASRRRKPAAGENHLGGAMITDQTGKARQRDRRIAADKNLRRGKGALLRGHDQIARAGDFQTAAQAQRREPRRSIPGGRARSLRMTPCTTSSISGTFSGV